MNIVHELTPEHVAYWRDYDSCGISEIGTGHCGCRAYTPKDPT